MCDILGDREKNEHFAKFISSIKSTMSEQGAINPLFNTQLKGALS